ncbi:MAG TPA: Ku protein [Longimicrobiales bacterium]
MRRLRASSFELRDDGGELIVAGATAGKATKSRASSRKTGKSAAAAKSRKGPKKAPARSAKRSATKSRSAAKQRSAPRARSADESAEDDLRVRPFWSGTVTFGLVSIPVDLYPANRPRQAGLRMLSEEGAPLRREYHNPDSGERIETREVVRGYEIEKGEYVVVTDEELEGVEPEKTRDISLDAFVDVDELDPMFFDRAYFLAPRENAGKAYRLLADVMEDNALAGIARFVMRSKEYLVAIMADGGILRAETMRFADEIRTPADVGLPKPKKPKPAEVSAMRKAIGRLAAEHLPEEALQDEYLAELRRIAEAKRKKGVDVVEVEEATDEEDVGVIDLMEALRRSMAAASGGGGKARKRA